MWWKFFYTPLLIRYLSGSEIACMLCKIWADHDFKPRGCEENSIEAADVYEEVNQKDLIDPNNS